MAFTCFCSKHSCSTIRLDYKIRCFSVIVANMEATGLAVGIAGLAGIFSTCLDCFELFQCAQSFREDFNILLLLLECQKERLLTWGHLVSKSKTEDERQNLNALAVKCLETIISLLSDAEKLQGQYGVQPMSTDEASGKLLTRLGSARLERFRNAFARLNLSDKTPEKVGKLRKTKWAICDKAKFEKLATTVKDLVPELTYTISHQSMTGHRRKWCIPISLCLISVAYVWWRKAVRMPTLPGLMPPALLTLS